MLRTFAYTASLALLLPAGTALAETPKAAPARQADLAESDAVGPWRTLIDAVRSASAREASD